MAEQRRVPFALAMACPACAGTLFWGIGLALGASALALKGGIALAVVGTVAVLWGRNIWRRRHEEDT